MTSNFDLFREAQRISDKQYQKEQYQKEIKNKYILDKMKLFLLDHLKDLHGKSCKYGVFEFRNGHLLDQYYCPELFLTLQMKNMNGEKGVAWFKSEPNEYRIWGKFYTPKNSTKFDWLLTDGFDEFYLGSLESTIECLPDIAKCLSVWF